MLNKADPVRTAAEEISSGQSVRKVIIKDLVFDASIGAYEEERERPQRVLINVQVDVVDPVDPLSDDLEDVLCYHKLTKGIGDILNEGHIVLVETVAERIAVLVLDSNLTVGVRVRVEKPDAIENAGAVGVEIYRSKA